MTPEQLEEMEEVMRELLASEPPKEEGEVVPLRGLPGRPDGDEHREI